MVASGSSLCYKAFVKGSGNNWAVVLAPVAVFVLFAPVLSFSLMGDDFQWVQHAHRASHRLSYLLADLDSFYRPTTTWTLAVDRLLWGRNARGFHFANVLFHAGAAAAMFLVARRLGLGPGSASVASVLWGVSPFAEESAVSVAIRFEDLLLLCWLALALAWPRPGTRARPALLASIAALAMLSKETWVVTPLLAFALAWGFSRKPVVASARATLPFLVASLAYVGLYFLLFPGDKSYFRYELSVLAKVPHTLAAFLHLEPLVPLQFPASWKGALATVAVAALVGVAIKRRHPAGVFGTFLLFAPMLPTLLVPYLPSRYLVAPYAGFLLLVTSGFAIACEKLGQRGKRLAAWAGTAVVVLVLLAHVFTVRADLRDWGRVSRAHAELVAQAKVASAQFPLDRPVAVVRADGTNTLRDIALSVEGWPKLFYVRGSDPGGLADAAALFQWVLGREDLEVRPVAETPGALARPGGVLLYRADGFHWLHVDEPNLEEAVRLWRERGFPVRVVEARRLPRLSL